MPCKLCCKTQGRSVNDEHLWQELYLVHTAEHLPLYQLVSVPILVEGDLIRRVLLPTYDDLEPQVQQLLLRYIMNHWHALQADAALTAALADTAFVPVARTGTFALHFTSGGEILYGSLAWLAGLARCLLWMLQAMSPTANLLATVCRVLAG